MKHRIRQFAKRGVRLCAEMEVFEDEIAEERTGMDVFNAGGSKACDFGGAG